MIRRLLAPLAPTLLLSASAQVYSPPDPGGFEGLIVETYYIADADDAADLDGGPGLAEGAKVYRVYADMRPGYKLISVGGFPNHPLTISTTTSFFNNDDRGEAWGRDIPAQHLNKNTVAIDSWLSFGPASTQHWGVLKSEDPDGSIVGGPNNQSGLLVNDAPAMGIPLTTADGLLNLGAPPGTISYVGTAPDCFDAGGSNSYSNDNFAWAILGGVTGPTESNRVLIGQFATDGDLSFCFHLALRIPDSLVCGDPNCHTILQFFSEVLVSDTLGQGYGGQNIFSHPTLCFNSANQQTDCLGVPNGPALPGTPCDDGNPDTSNDQYSPGCLCWGQDCLGTYGGSALPGAPCDDGNPATVNDTWQPGCVCEGVTGMAEPGPARIRVGPNPTRGPLRIDIEGGSGALQWELLDLAGKLVLAHGPEGGQAGRSIALDFSGLSPGSYLLVMQDQGRRLRQRIVKQ
ncbi:MAG: T9SS type A sorting domain-containing protein [Flavobacteriales bacterium]